MNSYSYLLLRLAIGVSMFGHGFVRLPKLSAFSEWMVSSFEASILPRALVLPFSYALPILEFLTGLFLILGWYTKKACLLGGAVMIVLIFGSSMVENWSAVPIQMVHAAFFAVVLHFADSNIYALDKLKKS